MTRRFKALFMVLIACVSFASVVKGADPEHRLDVFTQREGQGLNMPGGTFLPLEMVYLYANVTDSGLPVNDTTVAFRVFEALGGLITVSVSSTDERGIAEFSFRISPANVSYVNGTWSVQANADIDGEILEDTLTFDVDPELSMQIMVGLKSGGQIVWTKDASGIKEEIFILIIPEALNSRIVELYGEGTVFLTPFDLDLGLAYTLLMDSQPEGVGVQFNWYFYVPPGPGDVDGNGIVDIRDVARVSAIFGATPMTGNYDWFADLRFDFRIDIVDLAIVCGNFGKIY